MYHYDPQNCKVRMDVCLRQRFMAKTEKAKAACSVKSSESSHHRLQGDPLCKVTLERANMGSPCLHLDHSAVCGSAPGETVTAGEPCQTVAIDVRPELKSICESAKMTARAPLSKEWISQRQPLLLFRFWAFKIFVTFGLKLKNHKCRRCREHLDSR